MSIYILERERIMERRGKGRREKQTDRQRKAERERERNSNTKVVWTPTGNGWPTISPER